MNRIALNNYIDTNITNKIQPNSLSQVDEGNALKAVADYAESLVVSKVKKTSITATQILSIFDNRITIVPSPGNGKMIIPKQIIIITKFNTTPYSNNNGGAWRIMIGNSPIQLTTMTNYIGADTFDRETIQTLFYSALTTNGTFINAPLLLTTTSSNPVGGDSGIDVYVTYDEVTI